MGWAFSVRALRHFPAPARKLGAAEGEPPVCLSPLLIRTADLTPSSRQRDTQECTLSLTSREAPLSKVKYVVTLVRELFN